MFIAPTVELRYPVRWLCRRVDVVNLSEDVLLARVGGSLELAIQKIKSCSDAGFLFLKCIGQFLVYRSKKLNTSDSHAGIFSYSIP
jgi:hypothetical protein